MIANVKKPKRRFVAFFAYINESTGTVTLRHAVVRARSQAAAERRVALSPSVQMDESIGSRLLAHEVVALNDLATDSPIPLG